MSLDEQITLLCGKFEAAWIAGKQPMIRTVLERNPSRYRDAILEKLIPVDIECRNRAGLQLSLEHYSEFGTTALDVAREAIEKLRAQTFDLTARAALNAIPSTESDLPEFSQATRFPREATVTIGPYKILQRIAAGGMGIVFMAEQTSPVRRKVALKLIKAELDDQQIITRFEAERQALALMDNANIAKVLDAGTTMDGRPYFVMELVNGIPITEYCDKYRLPVAERLNLFTQTCRAIQHAHQKGIIHRDIKPSNVLVALNDGVPIVKVIDFGLAKAVHSAVRLTEKTMFTEFGRIIGTYQYMSPEQAQTDILDIDTRSDVYSLGVLLYELLTGSTPLERRSLQSMPQDQILVAIREQDAPRPSARLTSSGQDAATISEKRSTDTRRLNTALKADLDWITMKSLEKSRTRRYQSAGLFADDIDNYLRGDAVTARPPSLMYLGTRFVRRYRVFASVAMFVVCSTLIALLVSILGLLKYRDGERTERTARIAVEDARQRLERQQYFSNVEQAGQRLLEGNVADAKRLLGLCPEHLRGWEHKYLTRVCDESDLVIEAHSVGVRNANLNPSGTRILSTGADGSVAFWNATTGSLIASSNDRDAALHRIPLAGQRCRKGYIDEPNGRLILCMEGGEVKLLDSVKFNEISQLKTNGTGNLKGMEVCLHGAGVVCLYGNELSIWDISVGAQPSQTPLRRIPVLCADEQQQTAALLGVHPDGLHVAVFRQEMQLINLSIGKKVATSLLNPSENPVVTDDGAVTSSKLIFGRDGQQIAVHFSNAVVHSHLDGEAGPPSRLTPSSSLFNISTIEYEASGAFIFAGLENGQLIILDSKNGGVVKKLNGHSGEISAIETSDDGRIMCTASQDGSLRVWNLQGEAIQRNLYFTSFGCSPGGGLWIDNKSRTILRQGNDGGFELRDAMTLELKGTIVGAESFPLFEGTSLRIWTMSQRATSFPPELRNLQEYLQKHHFIRFPETGELAVIWEQNLGNAGHHPAHDMEREATSALPVPEKLAHFAISPDDQFLAAIMTDGVCVVIQLSTGEVVFKETLGMKFGRLSFIDHGRSLLIGGDGAVVLNVDGFRELLREHGGSSLAVSGDGRRIAFPTRDGSISVVDMNSNRTYPVLGVRLGVTAVELSSDGETLFTAGNDGTMRLWDVTTGREIGILHDAGQNKRFEKIAFSSELGCILAVDCHSEVYRWGVVAENATGDAYQQLGTARAQSLPNTDLDTTLRFMQEFEEVLHSGKFSLESRDPSLLSANYRVASNAILRLAQLRKLERTPDAWAKSEVISRILAKEASLPVLDTAGRQRKTLALFAQFELVNDIQLATLLGADVEPAVADELVSMLTQTEVDLDQVIAAISESQDSILTSRLLTLLTEVNQQFSDRNKNQLATQLNTLLNSADNYVRACSFRLINSRLLDTKSLIDWRVAKTPYGNSFNSVGQPLAYLKRDPAGLSGSTQQGVTASLGLPDLPDAVLLAVSMTEVTEEQFAHFRTGQKERSNSPITNITVADMAAFCNWLSIKEGLTPCYEMSPFKTMQTQMHINGSDVVAEENAITNLVPLLIPGATGYRLPRPSEFQYLGMHFSPQNSVLSDSGAVRPVTVASVRPDRNGLFDVFGNVAEVQLDGDDPEISGTPAPEPPAPEPPASHTHANTKKDKATYIKASFTNASFPSNVSSNFKAFGATFWHNPSTAGQTAETGIELINPRPDIGFRIVRQVFPLPPTVPAFRVTDSSTGQYVTSLVEPVKIKTAFGTRVVVEVYVPQVTYEQQIYTYIVPLTIAEERERTGTNERGEEVIQKYTVMVPVSETREGTRMVSHIEWLRQYRFFDSRREVITEAHAPENSATAQDDLTNRLTWLVESCDAGGCICMASFSAPTNEKAYSQLQLRIPNDVYVPIECQGRMFSQKDLPSDVARCIQKLERLPEGRREPVNATPTSPPTDNVSELRLLASTHGWGGCIAADGNSLFVTRQSSGSINEGDLYHVNLATGSEDQILQNAKDAACSPDGKWVACCRGQGSDTTIAFACIQDDSITKQLETELEDSPARIVGYMPSWSSDSQSFFCYNVQNKKLYETPLGDDSMPNKEIVLESDFDFGEVLDHFAQVSPDKSKIVFLDNDRRLLTVASASTRNVISTTPVEASSLMKSWNSSSSHVAYATFEEEGVWIMNATTGESRKILQGGFTNPRFSADGSKISVDEREKYLVHVFDLSDFQLP